MGGVLPLLTEHLVRAAQFDVRSELKKFHYDTALRAHPVGVFSALQVVGVSQLLFGTDAPLRRSIDQVTGLRSCGLSEDELRKIDYENARRLLNSSTFAFGGALHADQ